MNCCERMNHNCRQGRDCPERELWQRIHFESEPAEQDDGDYLLDLAIALLVVTILACIFGGEWFSRFHDGRYCSSGRCPPIWRVLWRWGRHGIAPNCRPSIDDSDGLQRLHS